MQPRARTALAVCLTLAVAAALAVWAWLPFDPFEGSAGRIDALVPADADAAFRCDGAAFLSAPFAVALRDHPDVADLRERLGIGEAVTAPLRRVEAAFAQGAGTVVETPTLARDLVPAEVVIASRGPDVLVLSRISSRARAIELLRREDADTLFALGVRIDGAYVTVLGPDGEPRLWAARHKDVLLAGTSREVVSQALTLAETGTGGLARRPGFDDALALGGASPAVGTRVYLWATPAALRRWTEAFGGAPWRSVLEDESSPGPVRVVGDLSDAARLRADIEIAWRGDALPAAVTALDTSREGAASSARFAATLAGNRDAVLSGGLAIRPALVLEALLRSAPPESEDAVADGFTAAGETPAAVASAFAAHLSDGVAFALTRPPGADRLGSGDEEPGSIRAIPATVVGFRLRDGAAGAAALEAEIRRRAEVLLGEPLRDAVTQLAPRVRVHVLPRRGLAGHWALLSPAFAFAGDWFVVSSNEAHLRTVLSAPDAASSDGGRDAAPILLRIDGPALRRLVEDGRWEAADRATAHDWPAERREIEAKALRMSSVRPADRADYVDARMRERAAKRRRDEIPRAAEGWRRNWRWLGAFSDASIEGGLRSGEARFRVEVGLTR